MVTHAIAIRMLIVFNIFPPPPQKFRQINLALPKQLTDVFCLFFTELCVWEILPIYFFGTEPRWPLKKACERWLDHIQNLMWLLLFLQSERSS